MDREQVAAAALQRLSRKLLAKKEFAQLQTERQAKNEKDGIVAPFVPTPDEAIVHFRDRFLKEGDALCDLGCGDGRVLLSCVPKISKGLGVDIQDGPLQRAKEASTHFNDKLTWLRGDFRDPQVRDFLRSEATVCFLFLLPDVLMDLLPYLASNMREGTRIICFTFRFQKMNSPTPLQWKPRAQQDIPGLPSGANTLYEYVLDAEMKYRYS